MSAKPFHELSAALNRTECIDRYFKGVKAAIAQMGDQLDHHKSYVVDPADPRSAYEPEKGDMPYRRYCFDIVAGARTIAVVRALFPNDRDINWGWTRFVEDPSVPEGKMEFAFRSPPTPIPPQK